MWYKIIYFDLLPNPDSLYCSGKIQNPLVKRVISIFDINQDGKVSFVEFLVGLGTFC